MAGKLPAHAMDALEAYEKRRTLMLGRVAHAPVCVPAATRVDVKERLKVVELVLALSALLALAVAYRKDPVVRDLGFVLVVSLVPILMESQASSRYLLAVTVTLIALVFRVIWLSRAAPVRALVVTGLFFCGAAGNNLFRVWRAKAYPVPMRENRQRVERELSARDGQQVVVVRYTPAHDPNLEWVFNSADIDGQKVIWARDLGLDQEQRLVDYYRGRHVWVVDAAAPRPEPTPYSP